MEDLQTAGHGLGQGTGLIRASQRFPLELRGADCRRIAAHGPRCY